MASKQSGYETRAIAARILVDVFDRKRTLDQAFSEHKDEEIFAALDQRDKGFVRAGVMTVLRRHGEIDRILLSHLEKGFPKKASFAIAVLRLAVAELLFLDRAGHGVLNSAVSVVAGNPKTRHLKNLTNAVLRRIAGKKAELVARTHDPSVNVPDWIFGRWCAHYGDDEARMLARCMLDEPPTDFTVRNKGDGAELTKALGAVQLPTGSLRLQNTGPIEMLPGFAEGRFWVQDAAAALPIKLFGDVDGKQIVDLCAAPGGKTLQLASAGADVTAIDASAVRLERISENLKRVGLDARLVEADARTWLPSALFEGVLLDAPCSATGTLRRHPDVLLHRRFQDLDRLRETQSSLLDAAAEMVLPDGLLIYCTCSLEPEEGEEQIEAFLQRRADFERLPVNAGEIACCAEFVTPSGDLRTMPYQWPDIGGLDGFYASRLRNAA